MPVSRWDDPSEMMGRLQSELDHTLRQVFGGRPSGNNTPVMWTPSTDLREDDNEIVIKMDLPAVKPEDVDIELTRDTLVVKGERKFDDVERRKDYVRVERQFGTFQRSWTIATPVQAEAIKAEFKDGVLTITLPKAEAAKPRKVQVTAG